MYTSIRSTPILLLAALFLAATPALAQAHEGSSGMQQQSTQPNSPDNGMSSNGMPNYVDQSFIEDTLKSNDVQVQASQLAQQKASSGDVKEFSQHMLQIHNQLNTQIAPFAKQLQINPNQKPSKKQREELAKLDQLSGPDFDTAYMQMMAREQQHTIKQFKSEEKDENPNIQKLAKADGPVLDQNYQILQKIAQGHNIPLDAK